MIVLVLLSLGAYFYSSYRKTIAPPILEIIVKCLLIIGFFLDLTVGIHEILTVTWIFGNGPVAAYFLIMLAKNHTRPGKAWTTRRLSTITGYYRSAESSSFNKIGALIHRHYTALNHAWVSDCIYLLMKPLECLFLLALYLFDRHPENRIAQQYLHWDDRQKLKAARSPLARKFQELP